MSWLLIIIGILLFCYFLYLIIRGRKVNNYFKIICNYNGVGVGMNVIKFNTEKDYRKFLNKIIKFYEIEVNSNNIEDLENAIEENDTYDDRFYFDVDFYKFEKGGKIFDFWGGKSQS